MSGWTAVSPGKYRSGTGRETGGEATSNLYLAAIPSWLQLVIQGWALAKMNKAIVPISIYMGQL